MRASLFHPRLPQLTRLLHLVGTAVVGAWLVAWETTGDDKYRALIQRGMEDIAGLPYQLFQGYTAAVGFDPYVRPSSSL